MTGINLIVTVYSTQLLKGREHLILVAVREVNPTDRASEKGIACKEAITCLIAHTAFGMTGSVDNLYLTTAKGQLVTILDFYISRS